MADFGYLFDIDVILCQVQQQLAYSIVHKSVYKNAHWKKYNLTHIRNLTEKKIIHNSIHSL